MLMIIMTFQKYNWMVLCLMLAIQTWRVCVN